MVYHQKYCSLDKAQTYCKSIVHVIKHANFQFYKAYLAGVVLQKRAIGDRYINKQVRFFDFLPIKRYVVSPDQ